MQSSSSTFKKKKSLHLPSFVIVVLYIIESNLNNKNNYKSVLQLIYLIKQFERFIQFP